jgi:hypothetical protein
MDQVSSPGEFVRKPNHYTLTEEQYDNEEGVVPEDFEVNAKLLAVIKAFPTGNDLQLSNQKGEMISDKDLQTLPDGSKIVFGGRTTWKVETIDRPEISTPAGHVVKARKMRYLIDPKPRDANPWKS